MPEVEKFLDDATKPPAPGSAEEALAQGDARMQAGDAAAAVTAYRRALALGSAAWARREHADEQLAAALQIADIPACATFADGTAPAMSRGRPFVNVVLAGLVCADQEEAHATPELSARLEALADEAVGLAAAEEDDRYQLYDALMAARDNANDSAGRIRYAERYLAYVESLPPPATDDVRAARDLSRLRAAAGLGDTARVLPALEATEQAMPASYAASQRLASAYLSAGRPADAIAAAGRGLGKSPGPMGTSRLLALRAAAEAKTGDLAAARRDLDAAATAAGHIPDPEVRKAIAAGIAAQRGHLPPDAPHG